MKAEPNTTKTSQPDREEAHSDSPIARAVPPNRVVWLHRPATCAVGKADHWGVQEAKEAGTKERIKPLEVRTPGSIDSVPSERLTHGIMALKLLIQLPSSGNEKVPHVAVCISQQHGWIYSYLHIMV
jgi:hypothetical protein